jgi:hypothetical protein
MLRLISREEEEKCNLFVQPVLEECSTSANPAVFCSGGKYYPEIWSVELSAASEVCLFGYGQTFFPRCTSDGVQDEAF